MGNSSLVFETHLDRIERNLKEFLSRPLKDIGIAPLGGQIVSFTTSAQQSGKKEMLDSARRLYIVYDILSNLPITEDESIKSAIKDMEIELDYLRSLI